MKHERNLYAMFRTEGAGLINESFGSLETLALMQHHGMPTRLLDWTESIHAALFFATMHTSFQNLMLNPCLWILNPYRLNYQSTGQNVIYDRDDKLDLEYYEATKSQHWPFDLPVAMAAPWRNPRVSAQRGYFTLHGNDHRPIEECTSNCVKRIDIPRHLVREIAYRLAESSTNHFTLFPDLDGLSLKLKQQFSIL